MLESAKPVIQTHRRNITIKPCCRAAFILLCGLLVVAPVAADSEQDYQRSVTTISKQIKAITRDLNANKAELKTERDRLFSTEQELVNLAKSVRQTEEKITTHQSDLTTLERRLNKTLGSQAKNRKALKALILSRYKRGDESYIKLLLNQENPYAVGRLNNYHRYFSVALRDKFAALEEQAALIVVLKSDLQAAINLLETQRSRQAKQKQQLSAVKKARAQSVAKLNDTVNETSKKLARLKKDRARLNALIKKIARQKAELARLEKARRAQEMEERAARPPPLNRTSGTTAPRSPRALVKGGFIRQKGRLSYPVTGKRKISFGGRLAESGMTSEGVFFDTKQSVPVKSIFRGRVLFADFLKGYGLLLIIDHGDDHISLYGHNELLYKKVGDPVKTNEVVAKTGVSGGLKSAGLYFEIRNNANPVNPATWCQ